MIFLVSSSSTDLYGRPLMIAADRDLPIPGSFISSGAVAVLMLIGPAIGLAGAAGLVTGVTAGTRVWGLLTGAGGSGSTYVVSPSGTTVSTTITATLNVETVWGAASYGAAGETVIISSEMFD